MHDIQQAIADWRRSLIERIGDDTGTLDELESHLREEIDRLIQQGQTPEQAVQTAIHKLGTPDVLGPEFEKLMRPQTWWPIRIAALGVALVLALILWAILDGNMTRVRRDGLLAVHVAAILTGYLLCFGIGAMAFCYAVQRAMQDLSHGQMLSWSRAQIWMGSASFVLTIVGVLTGAVWSHGEYGNYWSWDSKELGGLVVLAWQAIFLLSLWRFRDVPRWLMCVGVFGTVAVTHAWFSQITMIVVLVALMQAPALAVGLAPRGWLRFRAGRSA